METRARSRGAISLTRPELIETSQTEVLPLTNSGPKEKQKRRRKSKSRSGAIVNEVTIDESRY